MLPSWEESKPTERRNIMTNEDSWRKLNNRNAFALAIIWKSCIPLQTMINQQIPIKTYPNKPRK